MDEEDLSKFLKREYILRDFFSLLFLFYTDLMIDLVKRN